MLTRAEAEDFLYKEARMLDSNQLYEWRDMMTEDVVYWVPVNDENSDPLKHLSVIYDDKANLTGRSGASSTAASTTPRTRRRR